MSRNVDAAAAICSVALLGVLFWSWPSVEPPRSVDEFNLLWEIVKLDVLLASAVAIVLVPQSLLTRFHLRRGTVPLWFLMIAERPRTARILVYCVGVLPPSLIVVRMLLSG